MEQTQHRNYIETYFIAKRAPRKQWTQLEENFLRQNYREKGLEYCCKALSKTSASVFNKVCRLGLLVVHENTHEEMASFVWITLKKNAKVRGIPVEICREDIWNKFVAQERKCVLSGLDLFFGLDRKTTTASVDRIDSSKHYTVDNIQIVHKILNRMKMDISDMEFFRACSTVYKHLQSKYEPLNT